MKKIKRRIKKSLISRLNNRFWKSNVRINDYNVNENIYYEDAGYNNDSKFYNVGAGNFYHNRWKVIEYNTEWYDDLPKNCIQHDLTSEQEFPVKDLSSDIFYCSHVIEHLENKHVEKLFKDIYSALKSNGIFRVTCPDADLIYDAYKRRDKTFFNDQLDFYSEESNWRLQYEKSLAETSIEQLFIDSLASERCGVRKNCKNTIKDEEIIKIIEECEKEEVLEIVTSKCKWNPINAGYHINWWNKSKIEELLKKSGFKTIYKSEYMRSLAAPLRQVGLFDFRHPHKSIYMECKK